MDEQREQQLLNTIVELRVALERAATNHPGPSSAAFALLRHDYEQLITRIKAERDALRADKHRLILDVMECRQEQDDSYEYHQTEVKELEAERDALRAQLAAARAETWTPVNGDESERIMCACPDEGCYKAVEWDGTNLTIYTDVSEFDAGLQSLFTMIDLPENVRLCRRVNKNEED